MFRPTSAYSGFAVRDPAAAATFYRDVLGLSVEEMMDGYLLDITLPGGGAHVLVYGKPDHEPATYTCLNFEVEDVDVAVDTLTAAGVAFERFEGFDQDDKGISRGGEGPEIAWFRDPSGNIFAVHART